jgi:hypothetical protein
MKKINFFKEFTFDLSQNPCTLKYLAKYYLTKSLRKLFKELETKNLVKANQIIGLLLKLKFDNGSIKTFSTLRKGSLTDFTKLSTLFKHLLILRSENLAIDSKENIKVISIIFSYHIYPIEYNMINPQDIEIEINENKEIKNNNQNFIDYKVDHRTNIRYMNPLGLIKIPLLFSGSIQFLNEFISINKNVSPDNDMAFKYKINFNHISNLECEISIVLQENTSIVIYKFKDKLITVPKLEFNEVLIERVIMGRLTENYLIDMLNNNILLHKRFNINKKAKGFIDRISKDTKIKIDDLKKFITFDIECITDLISLKEDGDTTYFDPVLISAHDFYNDVIHTETLREEFGKSNPFSFSKVGRDNESRKTYKIEKLANFFLRFMEPKYHKFILYAHNLSNFDSVFILESLLFISDNYNIKIEPLIRDNKIISIKLRFGYNKDTGYRYYIEFHDSLLLLMSSLDKLSKTFLSDKPELQKMDFKLVEQLLLNEDNRKVFVDNKKMFSEIIKYCERDVLSLSHIIFIFAELIYNKWGISVHKYPTISSLGMGIYLSNYLDSDNLIPRISGELYKDLSSSYHGGHTDVYEMYSDEDVHSYDYSSMYPTQMFNKEMPVGKIDKFDGNPLNLNETFQTLIDKLAFIKCDVFVDKSLNRPTYMTNVLLNGEMRSVCATGLFKNQMIFVPELAYYHKLTNGLIKIIPDSIKYGYLFESRNLFKNYIKDLFDIKNSVSKDNPWYLIAKLLMNCLYGRMGLRQEIVNYSFLHAFEIENLSMNNDLVIKDVIDFDNFNKSLLISIDNKEPNLKSSVPIAAAITAYARMELAPLLLDDSLDIFYIDTDSYKCKQKITDLNKYKHLNHNDLGALKYEGTYSESLFLLPKVYGGIYKENNNEFTKVKGFKDKVEFDLLKNLLFKKQEIKLSQIKWYRNMLKSEIKLMKTPYILNLNENKRLIDLKTFKTKPYHFDSYDYEKLIDNKNK